MLSRILIREGADPKVSGNFYKTVAQAVLLFGAETWVLTQRMERDLDSFNLGLQGGSQVSSRGDGWMGAGTTCLWRRHWGSGAGGDKEVGHKEAENGRALYFDATDYGPL